MHTHYQNLKVPETASERDIRTAFRKLCHQYHPDKAPGNPEALRVMQIINDAYEVLSDPVRRAEYDQRLRVRRMMAAGASRTVPVGERYPPGPIPGRERRSPYGAPNRGAQAPQPARGRAARGPSYTSPPSQSFFTMSRPLLFLFLFLFMGINHVKNFILPDRAGSSVDLSFLAERSGSGPGAAPRDIPADARGWTEPAYLPRYPLLFNDGMSSLTVDNRSQEADVRLELMKGETVARTCLIPGNTTFTLSDISPGIYHVRYRNLTTENTLATRAFTLDEANEKEGVRFYKDALTLTREGHRLSRRPRFQRHAARS